MSLIARHFETGRWVEVALEGARIASVIPLDGPDQPRDSDDWVGPGLLGHPDQRPVGRLVLDPT